MEIMDRRELWRRVKQHRKSVKFEELVRLLEAYGWELDRIRGSHYIYKHGSLTLSVPFRRPTVLPIYVDKVLALLAGLNIPTERGGDDDDAEAED
jgi:predicted RNA binding protein YcfA (HicA-like mRNA interferase family)